MRTIMEKQLFDWSKNQNMRIKARGTMALLAHTVNGLPNLNIAKVSSRCEWPMQQTNSRYLTRKIVVG